MLEEKLPAGQLELELTESLLLDATEETRQQLIGLKALGLTLAMDDFGTGYSSLSYLKKFPIDVIKIDRSFIKDIPDNRDDVEITSAVIAMARKLHLKVVAEGIETPEQLKFLRRHRCDIGRLSVRQAHPGHRTDRCPAPLPSLVLISGKRGDARSLVRFRCRPAFCSLGLSYRPPIEARMSLRSQILVNKQALPTAEQALPGRSTAMPVPPAHHVNGNPLQPPFPVGLQQAVFGMGCFGARNVASGNNPGCGRRRWATPGITPNPTYDEVCSGLTGHTEAVLVVFDPR